MLSNLPKGTQIVQRLLVRGIVTNQNLTLYFQSPFSFHYTMPPSSLYIEFLQPKLWSTGQQNWPPLGTCQKLRIFRPNPNLQRENLQFNKISQGLVCTWNFVKTWEAKSGESKMTNIQYTKEKRQLNTTQLFFFSRFPLFFKLLLLFNTTQLLFCFCSVFMETCY